MATNKKTLADIRVVGIGSGNVASHLLPGLARAGVNIVQIYSRNSATANELARQCYCSYTTAIKEVTRDADVYLLFVPDDSVVSIARQLVPRLSSNATLAHTAGSVALNDLIAFYPRAGVFYPLQTFSKGKSLDLYNIPFLIEGANLDVQQELAYLAGKLSKNCSTMDSEKRMNVHLAAVASCNFFNHLLSTAYAYLDNSGIDATLLNPLMEETLQKFLTNYPTDTQTGPAKRRDTATVAKHQSMLADHPELAAIYSLFTQQLTTKYHANNI